MLGLPAAGGHGWRGRYAARVYQIRTALPEKLSAPTQPSRPIDCEAKLEALLHSQVGGDPFSKRSPEFSTNVRGGDVAPVAVSEGGAAERALSDLSFGS